MIITTYQSSLLSDSFLFHPDDFIICADAGYSHARTAGISPSVVIGDFDSCDYAEIEKDLERPDFDGFQVIRVAEEKDDTDTMICLKYGIDQGFNDFFILGGLGGRLDHTIANLQTMCYAVEHQKSIWVLDGKNRATLRNPGTLAIEKLDGYKISLFAFGESCEGVTISGVKYPLDKHLLKNDFPLGVSNEFLGEKAEIGHSSGKLLIILSQD